MGFDHIPTNSAFRKMSLGSFASLPLCAVFEGLQIISKACLGPGPSLESFSHVLPVWSTASPQQSP